MNHAYAICAFLLVTSTAFAAPRYSSVALPEEARLLITTDDGAVSAAPLDSGHSEPDDNQVGFSHPKLSDDRSIVGWLSLYPSCCTSYPIPLELVLQGHGTTIAKLRGAGLPIWEWGFRAGGSQVALRQSPTHGPAPAHYELIDIRTGKTLEEFDPDEQGSLDGAPQWALGLE